MNYEEKQKLSKKLDERHSMYYVVFAEAKNAFESGGTDVILLESSGKESVVSYNQGLILMMLGVG